MSYSFDIFGWYSSEEIPGRQTEIAPPEGYVKEEGKPYPNFTGFDWVLLSYKEVPFVPIPIPTPEIFYKSILTPLEFLNRFTNDEAKSIITLSKTNVDVELWWIKYNKAQDIDLDDPQTIEGVNMLEQATIIGPGRAEEILTKKPI